MLHKGAIKIATPQEVLTCWVTHYHKGLTDNCQSRVAQDCGKPAYQELHEAHQKFSSDVKCGAEMMWLQVYNLNTIY